MAPRFRNRDPGHAPHGAAAVFRWAVLERVTGKRRVAPAGPPAPRVEPDRAAIADVNGTPRVTWIGHASFLGSAGGAAFLVDPVFSQRIGIVVRRHGRPGITPDLLPPLDVLLVTHNHYDHLDRASVRRVARDVPVVVPQGLGGWFRGLRFEKVTELHWWETKELPGLRVTLVPARHWSRRHIGDTNRTLWGGFVIEAGGATFYHAGDSAWFDGFAEIGSRFPGILAAMLPVGSYAPAWFMEHHHLNPEQATRAFLDSGARYLVPMHWGALQLTDEPISEPIERLREHWKTERLDPSRLRIAAVGETLVF